MRHPRLLHLAAAAILTSTFPQAGTANPPANWDGLQQVPSKNADYLYLRPGADFSQYREVMFDPTEIAFQKDWQKEMNRSSRGFGRVTDADIRNAIDEANPKLKGIFEKRFRAAGFTIASAPGPNVMRIFVGVANVNVFAPDRNTPSSSRTYAEYAGNATVVLEARDSQSGELLGRAVDHGVAGQSLVMIRNSATNWADFETLFDDWARVSARGLRTLISAPAR